MWKQSEISHISLLKKTLPPSKAIRYLERQLGSVRDPYEIAIVAYALALTHSSEADTAHGMLLGMKRDDNGMVYWSRSKIISNRVRYEYNRPFLEPKDRQVGPKSRAGRAFLQALRVTRARILSFPLRVPRSRVLFQSFFFAYQDLHSRVLAFQIL